jgi:hypothetical protein
MASGQRGWLRYLSLIEDLETLNTWKRDPDVRSNMERKTDAVYAVKQYRAIMTSSTAQVFVMGYHDNSVCIFKSVLAQASPWSLRLPFLSGDGILEFMFRDFARSPLNLTEVLRRFSGYYLSSQPHSRLGIPIPVFDFQNIRSVEEAGFQMIDRMIVEGREYGIYGYPHV